MYASKLYWKELSEDGHLKEPPEVPDECGYSTHLINDYGDGFLSKEQAVDHLNTLMNDAKPWQMSGELVLVEVWSK